MCSYTTPVNLYWLYHIFISSSSRVSKQLPCHQQSQSPISSHKTRCPLYFQLAQTASAPVSPFAYPSINRTDRLAYLFLELSCFSHCPNKKLSWFNFRWLGHGWLFKLSEPLFYGVKSFGWKFTTLLSTPALCPIWILVIFFWPLLSFSFHCKCQCKVMCGWWCAFCNVHQEKTFSTVAPS